MGKVERSVIAGPRFQKIGDNSPYGMIIAEKISLCQGKVSAVRKEGEKNRGKTSFSVHALAISDVICYNEV
jgi:hypothetical protein